MTAWTHQERLQSTEVALKESDALNFDLVEANQRHDVRAAELVDEVLKGNDIVDQLTKELTSLKDKLRRKQARICEQVRINRFVPDPHGNGVCQ